MNYHSLVLIPQHAKLLFLLITLQHVGIWSTKIHYLDVRTALQAETKVYDQGKRILCTLDETRKPTAIESRRVNCRRPLTGSHRDDRLWSMGLLLTTKARFQF